ncbi:uncharacterized protein [Rutidosis leptorrhynchoides]|uniref:uncharacterized protein n=1 Tax=Rutidosis leptorrhynchoides TaxID=125765 RepID=UPI003A99D64B
MFKTETEALWVKVIRSIHGVCGGLLMDNLSPQSCGVWFNIINAGKDIEDLQVNFKNSFAKILGNGGSTLFWNEHWVGSDKLCNLFPRLYRLELFPDASVKDILGDGGIGSSENWCWRRDIPGRALQEFVELKGLLSSVSINSNRPDSSKWTLATNGLFKVSLLSHAIDDKILNVHSSVQGTLHNYLVPKKIEIFAWRALKKRLLVRLELDKRGIDLHSSRCPVSDEDLESVDHVLVSCKSAKEIWVHIFKWWNVVLNDNLNVTDLLGGDNPATPMSDLGKSIWVAIKWIGAYSIWKNLNNIVFRNKSWSTPVALNEIQTITFDWISDRLKNKKLAWQTWLSNPIVYLNIG